MSLEKWLQSGPVLTDGAWGTQLQSRGLAPGEIPDSWNLARPDAVAEVARSYSEAGSRILLTNTFRSNRIALSACGLQKDLKAINQAGVRISREASAGRAAVFASMGPSGKMLMTGEISEQQMEAAFAEQAQILAEAGADALVIETLSDLTEAKLALRAARRTGLPVLVSFAFDSGKNKDRTMTGVTPEQAAREMSDEGAAAVGANCGLGMEAFVPICRRFKAAAGLPVWIKANAGLPEMTDGKTIYRTTPEEFAACVPDLARAGADFIGGCCGTGPAFIAACKQRLLKMNPCV